MGKIQTGRNPCDNGRINMVLLDAEMYPDEFFRRDGLGFVTGGFERGNKRVVRYDKIRFPRNGAVAEFMVTRVLRDDREW